MYKTDITDRDWIIYDILGNIGWILYYIGLILFWKRAGSSPWSFLFVVELLCAVGILIGLLELIDERIRKLDRILPKSRLYRGFGLITWASCLGAAAALVQLLKGPKAIAPVIMMAAGGALCFYFCRLLLVRYKKIEE